MASSPGHTTFPRSSASPAARSPGSGSTPPAPPTIRPQRIPLGASRRRISYERRLRLWLTALAAPALLLAALLAFRETGSVPFAVAATLAFAALWAIVAAAFFDQLVRPLQTLANVVAALREEDFSFRARGARRGDSLGDLALEINALAGTLQTQRSAARDALTLVERVMTSMQSPVLAFGPGGHLRLLNDAAETTLHLVRRTALHRTAGDLGLTTLLAVEDEGLYLPSGPAQALSTSATRWSVRRSTFRLEGVPHTLLVLSDVGAALREEERLAWQRLIRVLSHEINNSLTPIKSIAGTLRTRLDEFAAHPHPETSADFHRGLTVVEERAASLNRFLQAYQQLTRLPAPDLRLVSVDALVDGVVPLETRSPIHLRRGPGVNLLADPDQLQQLLINLVRNAVEAAFSPDRDQNTDPSVEISWTTRDAQLLVRITDNGPGLTNPANLFVPFYTTKPGGSGVGLVLAQQIATAHRGSVALLSHPGQAGCTAELRLPIHIPGEH